MGMRIEFGPPHSDLDPRASDTEEFFADRKLSAAQSNELKRVLEDAGFDVERNGNGSFTIVSGPSTESSDWEYFAFGPQGGELQNPSTCDEVLGEVWEALHTMCDYAGWIVRDCAVGIVYGVEIRCPSCQGSLIDPGESACDEGHAIGDAVYEFTVVPPAWPVD